MAGGPTITVRQIASYSQAGGSPSDLVLVQEAGQGGPYAARTSYALCSTALAAGGPFGIGYGPIPTAQNSTLFIDGVSVPGNGGGILYNYYFDNQGVPRYWGSGLGGGSSIDNSGTFQWEMAPPGISGEPLAPQSLLMSLSPAGALSLPHGTLTVARDPGSYFEVATLGWVGNHTVASFNGRVGVVTLSANDVYCALGLDPCDPFVTCSQMGAAICSAVAQGLAMTSIVNTFNGRLGNVFLNTCDLNLATFTALPGMPPLMVPTPAALSDPTPPDPLTVPNIEWIENYLGANPPGYATEAWVTAYVAANAVTSFNGRFGVVTLSLADVLAVGGAPQASPQFSGVPTAPTAAAGSNTGQIATTAFVQAAISGATAGVASFNGRTGIVTLNSTDLTNAGGALLASPAFTGTPTAPTPAVGNSSTQIATTAFVAAAITAAGGVTSFNTRTGAITLTLSDVTGVGGAPLASPAFTGTPTGPTAATGTNNTELATTAFVNASISAIGVGVASFNGRTGTVTLQANDISAAGGLINPSVALTGVPTAPTAAAGTSSTQIATTAFVGAAILAGSVTTFNGRAGAVTLAGADITGAGGALLASPTFTGTPQAPTAAPGTNTTQIATTAFVTGALSTQAANSVTSFNGRQGVVTLTTADITGAGGAPIANPNFTGTPTVPTATAGTSTTQAASTAFVMAAIAASTAGVTSFNSRTGAVTLQANDISAAGGALLASPTFTGTPTAPTPTAGDNSTNIATTAFVSHALSTAAVTSFNTRTGAVTLTLADVTGVGGAPLASPAFTGTPTAPTATAGNSSTQLATTAFVQTALGGYLPLTGSPPNITGNLTVTGSTTSTTVVVGGAGGITLSQVTGAIRANGQIQSIGGANAGLVLQDRAAGDNWNLYGQTAFFIQLPSGQTTIQLNRDLSCWNTSGAWSALSDPRLKTNIGAYGTGLGTISQLNPITFRYNGDGGSPDDPSTVTRYGLDAQATQAVMPELVTERPGEVGGAAATILGIDTGPLVYALVNAVKQLLSRVQALESAANITPTAAETA